MGIAVRGPFVQISLTIIGLRSRFLDSQDLTDAKVCNTRVFKQHKENVKAFENHYLCNTCHQYLGHRKGAFEGNYHILYTNVCRVHKEAENRYTTDSCQPTFLL